MGTLAGWAVTAAGGEEVESLAADIGTVTRLARAASASPRADVRFAGRLLATAIADLARLLDEQFLRVGGSLDAVLAAYAADHGHDPRACGTSSPPAEEGA